MFANLQPFLSQRHGKWQGDCKKEMLMDGIPKYHDLRIRDFKPGILTSTCWMSVNTMTECKMRAPWGFLVALFWKTPCSWDLPAMGDKKHLWHQLHWPCAYSMQSEYGLSKPQKPSPEALYRSLECDSTIWSLATSTTRKSSAKHSNKFSSSVFLLKGSLSISRYLYIYISSTLYTKGRVERIHAFWPFYSKKMQKGTSFNQDSTQDWSGHTTSLWSNPSWRQPKLEKKDTAWVYPCGVLV